MSLKAQRLPVPSMRTSYFLKKSLVNKIKAFQNGACVAVDKLMYNDEKNEGRRVGQLNQSKG